MRLVALMSAALCLSSLSGCTRNVSLAELNDGDRKIELEMITYGQTTFGKSGTEEYTLESAGHTIVAKVDAVLVDGASVAVPEDAELIQVDVAEAQVTLTVDGEILSPES